MSNVELQKQLGFDQADLIANRKGEYSSRQKGEQKKFKKQSISTLIGATFVYILLAGGISVYLYSDVDGTFTFELVRNILFVWGIAAVILLLPVLNYLAAKQGPGPIVKTEGKISLLKVEKERTEKNIHGRLENKKVLVYEMRVDGKGFTVPESVVGILKEGDMYAVFHPQASNYFLSLELISKS